MKVRDKTIDAVMTQFAEDVEMIEAIETLMDKSAKALLNHVEFNDERQDLLMGNDAHMVVALRLVLSYIEQMTNEHGETWLYAYLTQYAGTYIESCQDNIES